MPVLRRGQKRRLNHHLHIKVCILSTNKIDVNNYSYLIEQKNISAHFRAIIFFADATTSGYIVNIFILLLVFYLINIYYLN